MLQLPATPATALSRYTHWNGIVYLLLGGTFYLAPGLVRRLLFMEPFAGHEEGYLRLLGVAVAVIGWFYVFAARARSEPLALATIADRLAVPVLLLPLYFTGQVEAGLVFAFATLDPLLALGAYLIWRRHATARR
jgi:hypothetical protein